jgi:hypothetical protein
MRVIRERPPPERPEFVPRLLIATFLDNPFLGLIAADRGPGGAPRRAAKLRR